MKSTLLLKNILTTFLGIFLSLVVIEIMLRILGYTPGITISQIIPVFTDLTMNLAGYQKAGSLV